jgi:histidinol-phosphate phosphatase family protein
VDRIPPSLRDRSLVLRTGGRGPAAARNAGWRAGRAPWVAFLDDDVVLEPGWLAALHADLGSLDPRVGASQGLVVVPLPTGRRPTDHERGVAGLAGAQWVSADIAYRRPVLAATGGFDERFRRAYREDTDLALRTVAAGWSIVPGRRTVSHPPGPVPWWASVSRQRGNADDALMDRLHGRTWRERVGTPRGRRRRHLAVAAAAAMAGIATTVGQRRVAAAAALAWAAGTTELAAARIAPGPRNADERAAMVLTSIALPFAATWWTVVGRLRHRRPAPWVAMGPARAAGAPAMPAAVLFDRDGTLVVDVPYNGDPGRVEPVGTARAAVELVRRAGVPTGVVTNQSGVARGLLAVEQVHAVNDRIEALLGPLGPWAVCWHGERDGCRCRKPRPGLVLDAAAGLAVDPAGCVVIGDTGADVDAARAAGARAILVPTARTRVEEVAGAPAVAPTLLAAVRAVVGEVGVA